MFFMNIKDIWTSKKVWARSRRHMSGSDSMLLRIARAGPRNVLLGGPGRSGTLGHLIVVWLRLEPRNIEDVGTVERLAC